MAPMQGEISDEFVNAMGRSLDLLSHNLGRPATFEDLLTSFYKRKGYEQTDKKSWVLKKAYEKATNTKISDKEFWEIYDKIFDSSEAVGNIGLNIITNEEIVREQKQANIDNGQKVIKQDPATGLVTQTPVSPVVQPVFAHRAHFLGMPYEIEYFDDGGYEIKSVGEKLNEPEKNRMVLNGSIVKEDKNDLKNKKKEIYIYLVLVIVVLILFTLKNDIMLVIGLIVLAVVVYYFYQKEKSNKQQKEEKVIEKPESPINLDNLKFISNNHKRYESGTWTGKDNYGAIRGFLFKEIGNQQYNVSIHILQGEYNWGEYIQMENKPMKIISHTSDKIILRGFGTDGYGGNYSDYGVELIYKNKKLESITLKLYDRNIEINYFNI